LKSAYYFKTIKHLPLILKAVKLIHANFNRQLDKHTASKLTLGDVINENPALAKNRDLVLSAVKSFVKLWSKLSKTVSAKLSSKIVSQFVSRSEENLLNRFKKDLRDDQDINLLIPISYLLPYNHGDGIYIYALIVFLIDAQNEFIEFYRNLRQKQVTQIDLDSLNENDCISVSPSRDFLNLVYVNSNYTLERVRELNLEFNFSKIQGNLENKFLAGKQFIDQSVRIYLHVNLFFYDLFNRFNRIFQWLNTRTQSTI